MPSFQGIYSIYYKDTPKSDKKIRLATLFKTGPFSDSQGAPSGIEEQKALEISRGLTYLTPNNVVGNPLFPGSSGVDLTFGNAPNLTSVAWEKAGDPSTPFTPDQRAPGNEISATAIDTDVSINVQPVDTTPGDQATLLNSLKKSYEPGAPGTGTASPVLTKRIVKIGQTLSAGSSDPKKSFT